MRPLLSSPKAAPITIPRGLASRVVGIAAVLLALVNSAKGLSSGVQAWGLPFWLMTYDHGFIKRGLVGTLFQAGTRGLPLDRQTALVPMLHLVTCAVFGAAVLLPTVRDLADSAPRTDRQRSGLLAAALLLAACSPCLPALVQIATALVLALHSPSAATAMVASAPLEEPIKDGLLRYQFGLHTADAVRIMIAHFRAWPMHVVLAAIAFLLPSVLVATCAAVIARRSGRFARWELAALVGCALLPAAVLSVAWDLSRLLVWTMPTSMVVLHFVCTSWPDRPFPAIRKRPVAPRAS
jgi:hypothetical protein